MPESNPLNIARATALLLDTLEAGREAACIAVLSHPSPEMVGARMVVQNGETVGSFLDPEVDAACRQLALAGLGGDPAVLTGTHEITLSGGDTCEVYLELHHPQPELVVVGAGHIAQPLATLGAILGLRVRVLDDRPQFATRERFPETDDVRTVDFSDPFVDIPLHAWSHVVLVTRGHRYDYQCLRKVLEHTPLPGYIGMIGSRRRVRATFEALLEEGFDRDALAMVRAPIGLDLGGETPGEIAVSVAAELVHFWNGGSGEPLQLKEDILKRYFPEPGDDGALSTDGSPDTPATGEDL
jgi:xanthine dehydrogenase accessory factor